VAADVRVSYVLARTQRALQRRLEEVLRPLGLSVPQYTALSVLRRRADLSNAQLARRSLITPQSMIEVLTSLEAERLVVRATDPRHARIRRARLTAAGTRLVGRADTAVAALEEEVLAGVPASRRGPLLRDLRTVMDRLGAGLSE
jgi:DNA-binding MarR family transcriptional regulator